MIGIIKNKLRKECGAVQIVEATFVFPIMFIILFFLIYMGNAQYIKAQIEAIVAENAIRGANYCSDPLLETLKEGLKEKGKIEIPSVDEISVEPYRYIFGGMDDEESYIANKVIEDLNSSSVSLFGNMNPKLKTAKSDIAKFNNYLIYSTFSVNVKYELKFPIKFWGESTPKVLTINSYSEIAVNDTSEFIRNTDMVIDYFENTEMGEKIKGTFEKINEFLQKFAGSTSEG